MASFVFCFYNSMTLAQCEYNGRYYGGGVRELVPSELQSLTIPYETIEEESADRRNCSIRKCSHNYKKMLPEEIKQLRKIRIKLMKQRNAD